MIRLAVVGGIGSGKTYISKLFGYPVFNADAEVAKLYKKSRKCYNKFRKVLPYYIKSFPIKKACLLKAIIDKQSNLKKIVKIIHPQVRERMNIFLNKNKNKKFVVLDIPLLMENKINRKNDIIIFINAKKKEINKRLKIKYKGNEKIIKKFKKFQLPVELKKKKAHFIIKNNFKKKDVKKNVKKILGNFL